MIQLDGIAFHIQSVFAVHRYEQFHLFFCCVRIVAYGDTVGAAVDSTLASLCTADADKLFTAAFIKQFDIVIILERDTSEIFAVS